MVVAPELMAAAQGLDFRRPLRSGDGVEWLPARVREVVPPLAEDRSPSKGPNRLRHRVLYVDEPPSSGVE